MKGGGGKVVEERWNEKSWLEVETLTAVCGGERKLCQWSGDEGERCRDQRGGCLRGRGHSGRTRERGEGREGEEGGREGKGEGEERVEGSGREGEEVEERMARESALFLTQSRWPIHESRSLLNRQWNRVPPIQPDDTHPHSKTLRAGES